MNQFQSNFFSCMTFNIKNSHENIGKELDWNNRKEKIIQLVDNYQPTIIGFQEVLSNQLEYLISELKDYSWIGVGRDDGKNSGEFTPIFYKDFSIEKSGTFWLSDTPDIPSNTWGGCYRICSWIKTSGINSLTILNTHLDEKRADTRIKSISLILDRINTSLSSNNVILMGDFNFTKRSREYKLITKKFYDAGLTNKWFTKTFAITYHGFTGSKYSFRHSAQKRRIDFVFFFGSSAVAKHKIISDKFQKINEIPPSDHWPIQTTFKIK